MINYEYEFLIFNLNRKCIKDNNNNDYRECRKLSITFSVQAILSQFDNGNQ
jgi:hypothetical protein